MNNLVFPFVHKAKPILKWAGGKTQMLDVLIPLMPNQYCNYIEPFFGGGALFFAIQPQQAIISDTNPELINLYRVVSSQVEQLILELDKYYNDQDFFYEIRALKFENLDNVQAAARTIFLNKTCFNGLYRVNKIGVFYTPFGKYKNPNINDSINLLRVSDILKNKEIIQADYFDVLEKYAKKNDFIFLDPPYFPISQYSDFKRYTKEQFSEQDQFKLSQCFKMLVDRGCYVLLTNSNHPLVYEYYSDFEIRCIDTKRHISCKGGARTGEDIIVIGYDV